MRKELFHYAEELHQKGFLMNPGCLAAREGDWLYSLYPSAQWGQLNLDSIEKTRWSDIGPSDFYLNLFRQALYRKPRSYTAAILSQAPFTELLSQRGGRFPAKMEDSAQIIGPVLRTAQPGRIRAKRRMAGALLVKDTGGLCVASSFYDLEGCALVLEKTCRAEVDSWFLGGGKSLGWLNRTAMRSRYRRHYSLLAEARK